MKYSSIPLSQTVIALCQLHKIEHIVISPGSRNAPLTLGFTNHDYFKCYSIVDERCAGFFALGIAQQTQRPVVLVCTSGSAILNYYPAIAEAYYSNIPLIVISADRPKHLIDIGDGQTIKQRNVYGEHVVYSANLKLDLREENTVLDDDLRLLKSLKNPEKRFLELQDRIQLYNETEINKAIHSSITSLAPVHINCPFDEPLYESVDTPTIELQDYNITNSNIFDCTEIEDCINQWNKSKRKLILVGVLQPNSIESLYLEQLAKDDSVIVLTETTSNLHNTSIFNKIDVLIAPLDNEAYKKLQPDLLVTFGGMVVSKKIKAFLRNYKPKEHWHVDLSKANDTFFSLTKHLKLSPNEFLKHLLPTTNVINGSYNSCWQKVKQHRLNKHYEYLYLMEFSDFKAFEIILDTLPYNSQLQVGNSSAIRYTQLFDLREDVTVFCNRGTSGIDGSTSTAIGAAISVNTPVTFITGDLSFFYDSNALWNNYIPNTFRIIVVNNEGGGIFRILPGHKNTSNFDTYFETKHNLTAEKLCEMYGIEYLKAEDETTLKTSLNNFYSTSNRPKLLEVFTPARKNDEILLEYFNYIK